MKCKDDNTCDQPATKGDLERVYRNIIVFGFGSFTLLGLLVVGINKLQMWVLFGDD